MALSISKIFLFFFRIILIRKVKGFENIPNKTPFIIVANHESRYDHIFLLCIIIKKLNKKIYFIAIPRWWYSIEFIRKGVVEVIPMIDTKKVYKQTKETIKSGGIVCIFPEGRLERKNRRENPKTGAIRLALETKVPILPIGIKLSYYPFSSIINIGKSRFIRKKENIKKQTKELMKYVYKLRDAF